VSVVYINYEGVPPKDWVGWGVSYKSVSYIW